MRLAAALRYDVLFQFRHGFYYAYGIITLFYCIALLFVPVSYRDYVLVFLLFSDTTVLGFFFVGGMMILEKDQRVYDALFVTPLRIGEYYASRVGSLTVLALFVSSIIVIISRGMPENIFVFILSIILASTLFTLLGMAIGSKTKTVNGYFIASVGYTLILVLPILDFLHLVTSKVFLVIPTSSVLFLIEASLAGGDSLHIMEHIFYLLLWNVIIALWAWKRFQKYVIYSVGGTK